MKVAVIGQGYVGLTVAAAAASVGHHVIGIDSHASLIDDLNAGVSHIPGVENLPALVTSGSYKASPDCAGVSECEVVIIAVPTPLDGARKPDLTYLQSAVQSLRAHVKPGSLVVNESTSYPGTLREIIAPQISGEMHFAAAPERVDPGNSKWNSKNTPRLVGGLTNAATKRAADFYRSFCDEVIEVSSPDVAEAAKLFENTFRQVNIALVNEFAQVAHSLGIPTLETLQAAASKPFGFMPFTPSAGVGGHCIPIDPTYLSFAAERSGMTTRFINLANEVNTAMPNYVANRIKEVSSGSLQGKKIQVVGIAYKAEISDTRESPGGYLVSALRGLGASVTWHDPFVPHWNNEQSTAIFAADIGVIVTAHPGVDYSAWKNADTMVFDVSISPNTGWPKFL